MLTDSMTYDEVWNLIAKERSEMEQRLEQKAYKMGRLSCSLTKFPSSRYSEQVSSGKTKYLFVLTAYKKQLVARKMYAILSGEKPPVYFSVLPENFKKETSRMLGFTTHFFHRYAERMHLTTRDIRETICMFDQRTPTTLPLASTDDDKRPVFIIPDGIMLGSIHANGCYYVNTFVSRDLLKSTQIEAAALLDDIIEGFGEINSTCDMEKRLEIYHTLKIRANLSFDKRMEIYNSFYEE